MNNGSFDLDNVVIEGHHVRLEPYEDALREPIRQALDCDPEGRQLFAISGQGAHFDTWWDLLNAQVERGEWIAYAIRQRATDAIVGTTSFLNIRRTRQCVEIGATFLHPAVRSTLVNAEAKYLMLRHAFEEWDLVRVELKTSALNQQSRGAMRKLGAVEEGILRRHMINEDGSPRDSVFYSILVDEWPKVKAGFLPQ